MTLQEINFPYPTLGVKTFCFFSSRKLFPGYAPKNFVPFDNIGLYNDVDATIIGIFSRLSFTLAAYKEAQQYNFPLLSDFNKEVSSAHGALYEHWILDMKGVSKRSAFIVNKDTLFNMQILETAGRNQF
jgi:alkyl hydroperoxide reductase subunit AhpC